MWASVERLLTQRGKFLLWWCDPKIYFRDQKATKLWASAGRLLAQRGLAGLFVGLAGVGFRDQKATKLWASVERRHGSFCRRELAIAAS
ncbi:MAG: hypothetical protein SPH31_08380 [Arcanobacterium sp.]|nr:hypothetical protein [Arcanobacterium sp.]